MRDRAGAAAPIATPVFEARQLCFRYRGASGTVVADVDVQVPPGSLYAILGPNGSGKSTLVRLLLGALSPEHGTVFYAGRAVRAWPRRTLAKQVGVVPQMEEVAFPLTVKQFVAMGRYPHLGAFELTIDDYAQPAPSSRGALTFAKSRDGAVSRCDLVLDVSGAAPLHYQRCHAREGC